MNLKSRTDSLLVANLVFEDCIGRRNVVSLEPRCAGKTTRGIIQFLHVEFRNLTISGNHLLLETIHPRCAQLSLENVRFRENQCGSAGCVSLLMNNTMKNVYLVGNREEENRLTRMSSSTFILSQDSEATTINISASGNRIRLFSVFNSTFTMRDSYFDGNAITSVSLDVRRSVGGSVLLSSYSRISIRDSVFLNNSGWNGGALYAFASDLSFHNCTFRENDAGIGYGGALVGMNVNAAISLSRFVNNTATWGGACTFHTNSAVKMIEVQFTDNHARESGGAVYTLGSRVDTHRAFFHNNSAIHYGSAMFCQEGYLSARDVNITENSSNEDGTVYLRSCSALLGRVLFCGNFAQWYGGALYSYSSNITARHSTFEKNSAGWYGGAIVVRGRSKFQISNSKFHNNSVGEEAGAIYAWYSDIAIRASNFTSNTANRGGSYYLWAVNATLERVLLSQNQALDGSGGGVYVRGGRLRGELLVFLENQARKSGGAIDATDFATIHLSKVSLHDNKAGYNGGGACFSNASATMRTLIFFKNKATDGSGGGVYSNTGRLKATSLTFRKNRSSDMGGGISAIGLEAIHLSDVIFEQNYGSNGGAIGLFNTTLDLSHSCTFTGNNATKSGGSIYHRLSDSTISSCRFEADVARSGGSLWIGETSRSNIVNCTFNRSVSTMHGGGIQISKDTRVSIYNSFFSSKRVLLLQHLKIQHYVSLC